MKVLLWLVKNRINKNGESPIFCRITISGNRAETFSGIYAKGNEWDADKQKIKGNSEAAKQKNSKLSSLVAKINNTYYSEVFNGNNPTAQEVKLLLTNTQKKILFFIDVLQEYANEKFRIFANSTLFEKHTRFISIIKKALTDLKLLKIQSSKCDSNFLDQLAHHIVNVEGYSVGYTKKVFAFIKSSLMYAFNRRYISNTPAYDYKLPYREKQEIVYLEECELRKILNYNFTGNLQKYADLFLIQCYTGLAYADLIRLNSTNLIKDSDGLVWINITRQKVEGAECIIPVIGKAWKILAKYNFSLPSFSNQKYNAALKKIASEVGIRKKLTTHVGRKTYGTILLNKDVPIETVSKLLGHSNIRITQKHYAKVLHMKIARDVRLVL